MVIVTTTINEPTVALHRYAQLCEDNGWHLIVVGDRKTPRDAYRVFEGRYQGYVEYVGPEQQEARFPALSELIGWNCIQRRNIGFLLALEYDAEIIATVDDDNIPYDHWGENVVIGREGSFKCGMTDAPLFDPLSMTDHPYLWHRGFPVHWLWERQSAHAYDWQARTPLVQADLWDGDPDVDAICRMVYRPHVQLQRKPEFFVGNRPSPFNSQNTFLHRSVMAHYFLFPGVGRMDDIWASLFVQHHFPACVVYGPASVYQMRNAHDPLKDMAAERIGMERTHLLAEDMEDFASYLPDVALRAYAEYKGIAEGNV